MKQHALIWDMDGTLVGSYPAIVPAVREVLSGFGLELPEEEIHRAVIQSSVRAFLDQTAALRGLDAAALQAAFARLNDSRIESILPMPHARETLAALRRAGHLSFVYTHRGASCPAILEQTGLAPYFTEVVSALAGFPRKPAPDAILYLMGKYGLDPARCWYVGDRSLDLEAAANAGIGSFLYLEPSAPGRPDGRASFLIRDLLEIPALLEQHMRPEAD